MKICIIGAGYVGLTTATALGYLGHEVHCIDQNQHLVQDLTNGIVSVHEPGIKELLALNQPISFGDWTSFDENYEIIFIAVGTPRQINGAADLTYVKSVASEIGKRIYKKSHVTIVLKSTVPIGSSQHVHNIIDLELKKRNITTKTSVASNPEFLREGTALFDFLYPDRIVVGANEDILIHKLFRLYEPILSQSFSPPKCIARPQNAKLPIFLTTTPTSAELIKYAANAFLAMKISFINEFSGLAEHVGADIASVSKGIGLDERIGLDYLKAGAGWGGSCFGKDISAILHTANHYNFEMHLLEATVKANIRQHKSIVKKLQNHLKVMRSTNIGILGISFKPNTDDVRDAPFLYIAQRLIDLGANVKAYDPVAIPNCKKALTNLNVIYCNTPQDAAVDCDALVILTEWEDFRSLDYKKIGNKMRRQLIIDGRNMLNKNTLENLGFKYVGVGR